MMFEHGVQKSLRRYQNLVRSGHAARYVWQACALAAICTIMLLGSSSLKGSDSIVQHHEPLRAGNGFGRTLTTQAQGVNGVNTWLETDVPSKDHAYDFDLIIMGGGSGGIAAAMSAARLGAKVAVADYVKPSHQGTTWGVGGTCVNVGCIPKKLFHISAGIGEAARDTKEWGWGQSADNKHDWHQMVSNVNKEVQKKNEAILKDLAAAGVTYYNMRSSFVDERSIKLEKIVDGEVVETMVKSAERIVVATGTRPNLDVIPEEYRSMVITSDDFFWSKNKAPGDTLLIGRGYIAVELAGAVSGLGYKTTVMTQANHFSRAFDQDAIKLVKMHMQARNTEFLMDIKAGEWSLSKLANGKTRLTHGSKTQDFDTVILAMGRKGNAETLGLENAGIPVAEGGYIAVDAMDRTAQRHIYAIGDIALGREQLTPIAIKSAHMLVNRLYGGSKKAMDHAHTPATLFASMEYGWVGVTEKVAEQTLAKSGEKPSVYMLRAMPLEWTIGTEHARDKKAMVKIIADPTGKIMGIHFVAPNAGEIMQGLGIAFRKGLTMEDIEESVAIHPTTAEMAVKIDSARHLKNSTEHTAPTEEKSPSPKTKNPPSPAAFAQEEPMMCAAPAAKPFSQPAFSQPAGSKFSKPAPVEEEFDFGLELEKAAGIKDMEVDARGFAEFEDAEFDLLGNEDSIGGADGGC